MKICKIIVNKIYDSRAEETLNVCVVDENDGKFFAEVPSGKSRGKNEAEVVSAEKAIENARIILSKEVVDKEFNSVREFDEFLISLDGAKNKAKLGGNLILGLSIAFARALAFNNGKELWQILHEEFFPAIGSIPELPMIFANLINGGAHANNNLNIQEYMVILNPIHGLEKGIAKLIGFYRTLGKFLITKNKLKNITIGDEGGYAISFQNNFEPLEILNKLIHTGKLEKEFSLGMDVAASSFYKNGKYVFEGKKLDAQKLKNVFIDYFNDLPLLKSIEDPFSEEDFEGFKNFGGGNENMWVVGDDLTTTNPFMINRFAKDKLINAVIIKANQIGSLTETCDAMLAAKDNNMKIIVSHRSGETNDNFLVHLARAAQADGVKIGAPIRERIFKYNELMRIYNQ